MTAEQHQQTTASKTTTHTSLKIASTKTEHYNLHEGIKYYTAVVLDGIRFTAARGSLQLSVYTVYSSF